MAIRPISKPPNPAFIRLMQTATPAITGLNPVTLGQVKVLARAAATAWLATTPHNPNWRQALSRSTLAGDSDRSSNSGATSEAGHGKPPAAAGQGSGTGSPALAKNSKAARRHRSSLARGNNASGDR